WSSDVCSSDLFLNLRHTPGKIQKLPGWIHLQRSKRQKQRQLFVASGVVGDAVTRVQNRRIHRTGSERGDYKVDVVGAPDYLWQRQSFLIGRHRCPDVVPGEQLAIGVQER